MSRQFYCNHIYLGPLLQLKQAIDQIIVRIKNIYYSWNETWQRSILWP